MNEIDVPGGAGFRLRVIEGRCWPLREMWRRCNLTGTFWRFYHNDAPGAGVWLGGRKYELRSDCCYLVAPQPELVTWQDGDPTQFYLHFEPSAPVGRPRRNFYEFGFDATARRLVELVRTEMRPGPEFFTTRGAVLAAALAGYALGWLPEGEFEAAGTDPAIARAQARMRSRLDRELTVGELAAAAGLSCDAFIRRFRRQTGMTPYRYFSTLRLEQAAFLLANGDLPVEQIAGAVGFRDRFHFSRCFKRQYGEPPAAYRRVRRSF